MDELILTDLEKDVVRSLRLSDAAAEKILGLIQRYVNEARAEMIRSGISEELANSNHVLVESAIITWCLYNMDDEKKQDRNLESFRFKIESLRKSTIDVPETEVEDAERNDNTENSYQGD